MSIIVGILKVAALFENGKCGVHEVDLPFVKFSWHRPPAMRFASAPSLLCGRSFWIRDPFVQRPWCIVHAFYQPVCLRGSIKFTTVINLSK